ncbi:MAG: monofunctional biosynthetic peptidoglycan transglycosylase [Melioribacteraceae bacterium]|nr:MAG: monofunctional biosynthetic peptidoglycan transglycosylase [Melioribacteraceae bacterium]
MKKIIKNLILFLFSTILTFIILSTIIVFIFYWFNPPTTAFIQAKSTHNLFVSVNDYEYEWKSLDKASLYFPLAVIASEDQAFFGHSGFDFKQIQKAMDDIERGRRFRGASTISQQTAKNLFLWEDQSYIRKGFEAYFTLLIELLWSKKRILEVYINVCELGKDVYGVEAASQLYFRKSSEKINQAEAALLATVLPKPLVRNPARPSHYMINRREDIMRQMNNIGGREMLKNEL